MNVERRDSVTGGFVSPASKALVQREPLPVVAEAQKSLPDTTEGLAGQAVTPSPT